MAIIELHGLLINMNVAHFEIWSRIRQFQWSKDNLNTKQPSHCSRELTKKHKPHFTADNVVET